MNSHLTSVDQAVNLQKTNPDLVLHPFAYRAETAINWNNQKPPFDDIRVRRAISMAIDFEAIAKNYMQGWGDASLVGGVGKAVLGYFMPYEEWPDEVKQYYRYDPEAAEKLLDEAGFPRGADGTRFSTIYQHYEFFDLGYYQIAMDLPPADWHRRRDPGNKSRAEWRIWHEPHLSRYALGCLGHGASQCHGLARDVLVAKRMAPPKCQRRLV